MIFNMEISRAKQVLNADPEAESSHETFPADSTVKTTDCTDANDEVLQSAEAVLDNQAANPETAKKKKRVKINIPKERTQSGANKNNNNTAPLAKIKLVRHKRKPSRYQDCLFDIPTKLMNINRTVPAEVFRECHKRTPKILKSKSTEKLRNQRLPSPPSVQTAVFCAESAGGAVTFDEEGNFRFKVCKEHTIRSKLGGVTSYRCDICDMLFPRSFSLSRHYERLHINPRFIRNKGKKDQEIISKLTQPNGQESSKDNKKGDSEKGIEENATTASDRSTSDSEIPAEIVNSAESDETGDKDASFYLFACKLCSRQKIFFTRKEELRRHHQAKHGNLVRKMLNVFKCDSCERSYPTRHELRRHQRSHSGERPYACRFCAKRFPTSTNARRHERTHTGDRPHLCKVCKKGFIQKTDMVKHLRSVHKMKVTKTKAERAVRMKRKVKSLSEAISTSAPALPKAPTQTATSVKRVRDKTNEFEENIDFAAYLKLDQFEKGSLMGGQSVVESTGVNNRNIGATSTQERGSERAAKGSMDDPMILNSSETLGVDGKPRRGHKCTECPKSFTSQVNLRRHFRLKHERNQVVRAAMPVSMVVEKFKIQDEEEGKDEENKKLTVVDDEINKGASPHKTKEKKNEQLDNQQPMMNPITAGAMESTIDSKLPSSSVAITPSFLPNSSPSVNVVSVTKNLSPRKIGGKQHGSKLSSILQRLSNRQDSALKTVSAQPTGETKQQATAVDDAQRRNNKRKLPVPSQRGDPFPEPAHSRGPNLVHESDLFPMPEKGVSSLLIAKAANSLRSPHRQQTAREVRKIRARTFHPYYQAAAPVMSPKEHSHKISPRKTKYSMPEAIPNYFVTFSSTPTRDTANADVTYTVAHPKRHSIPSTHQVGLRSSQSIVLQKPSSSYRKRSSHSRPHISPVVSEKVRGALYKTAHIPRPEPTGPTVNLDYKCTNPDVNPLNLKVSSGSKRPREKTAKESDSPLDLRHPSKKHTHDYIVTDNGALDFSKKTRESLQDGPSELERSDLPLALTKSTSCLHPAKQARLQENLSVFKSVSGPSNQKTLQKLDAPSCVAPTMSMNLPLKFHDVKFHKGRQVDGAGTAGRPMSLRRINRSQRPRSHQGDQFTASPHLSDSRFNPYSGMSSRMHQNSPQQKRQPPQYLEQRRYSDDGFVPIVSTPSGSNQPPSVDVIREQLISTRNKGVTGNTSYLNSNFGRQPPRYPTHRPSVQYPIYKTDQPPKQPVSHSAVEIPARRTSLESLNHLPGSTSKVSTSKQESGRHNKSRLTSWDLDRDVMTRCIQKAQYQLKMQAIADARQQRGQLSSIPTHPSQTRTFQRGNVNVAHNSPLVDASPLNEARSTNMASTLHNINDHQLLTRDGTYMRHESNDSTSDGIELLPGANKDCPGIRQRVSSRNELTMTPGFDTNGEDSSRDGDETDRIAPLKSSPQSLQPTQPLSPKEDPPTDHPNNVKHGDLVHSNKTCTDYNEKSEVSVQESVSNISLDLQKPDDGFGDKMISEEDITDPVGNIRAQETTEDVDMMNSPTKDEATFSSNTCKIFTPQHTATSPSGIKETNLSTESGVSGDCQLRETNLSKLDSAPSKCENESPVTLSSTHKDPLEKALEKSEPVEVMESSRKFVQKLKLRAVKSQDGASKTQWTLVGNGQNVLEKVPEEKAIQDLPVDPKPLKNTNEKPKTATPSRQKLHAMAVSPRRRSKAGEKSTPNPPPVPESVVQKESTETNKEKNLDDVMKHNEAPLDKSPHAAEISKIVEAKKKVEQKCKAVDEPAANEPVESPICNFVVLLDREAVHNAVLALQTEQQVRRALRHEKNLLLKSKRDENPIGETPTDEDTVKTDKTKEKTEAVECIGKNVDIKSDGEQSKESGSTVALANSSYVRRSAKQINTNNKVEIVPVVKDHTYVKQDRNADKEIKKRGEKKKQKVTKSGIATSRKMSAASARRAKNKRIVRTRSVGVAQKKVGPSKAASNVVKTSVVKHIPPTNPTTVVIKADFVLKVQTSSALVPKAQPRKIDLSKILPPVSVHTKRSVPVLSGRSSGGNLSNKRRSIRKYSKDFLPK
uniref:Zinc finger protein 271 n=1 Tax=Phallusia mammillata TaxID=59560 RepID=A0A6F9DX10_9ASCI|nr:zinc finger protein 271 [Phallusia mammillata]